MNAIVPVALLSLVALTGCAPTAGTVIETGLTPAHSEQYVSSHVCVSYDTQTYACTYSMPIYATRWVPDTCWVRVVDDTGEREGTWTIGCGERDQYVVGRWVDHPPVR